MSAFLHTQAIVLKHRSLLNQDQVITVFSEPFGKLRLLAKGIRKITSRRLSHMQTGNLVRLGLQKRAQSYYLRDTALVSSFYRIKRSSAKTNRLYLLLFILDRVLAEDQPEPKIYQVVLKTFVALSGGSAEQDLATLTGALNLIKRELGYGDARLSFPKLIGNFELIIGEKIPVSSI
ncbi:DNA repair protein RecO [Patescibacteria group bacterium]|nr:DNA repair protein RecO [Patescibacteria group bacterium]MCL5091712.1 DNA repair protein RecO [Patescibacteria group bacterium]